MNLKRYPVLNKLLIALLSCLLFFLLFQLLYRADNKYTSDPPYGMDGHFTFTENDLTRGSPLFLVDGWQLYRDRQLSPLQLAEESDATPQTVFIGQYPNFSFFSPTHSPFGEATYRLCLDNSGPPQILALEIPEIFTDYTLWINGEEVSPHSGSVSFLAERETELVLAVSNQSHYYSGLTYPPALGLPQTLSRMFLLRNLFYGLLCIFPLALCLYAAGASRDREPLLLHFGLLCLFFALHCAHPFVHQLGLTGRLWYAAEDSSWLAVLYCAIAISSTQAGFNKKHWYRKVLRPICILAIPLCAASVLFILPKFDLLINLYGNLMDFYKFFCWLYLLFCALYGIYRKQTGSGFILSGAVILGASMVINLLDNNHFEPIYTGWQTEYAGFFMVLIFWGLTVQRTRIILRENQRLTRHLEEEVQQRTSELNTVLQERKAFFSDLAHNLKAPMTAIQGFTQLILQGNVCLDTELKETLAEIGTANSELARRMQVLGELNAYDKLTEAFELLDVDEFLTQVYTDNVPESTISGIRLLVEKLNTPAQILVPRKKLLLLFENLIYNSLSFTPEDGSISISPSLENNRVVISVSDTGTGIAPEHLPHIFERFYVGRIDQSAGSGLGLYIVKLIVDEIGGSIDVESTLGKGTTFTLRFPISHLSFG